MELETKRLILRELAQSDYADLCKILQDSEVMYAYEGPFSDAEVQSWLDKQLKSYRKDGFGLCAVILKETGEMIGQCGLTLQRWKEQTLLEIGYLFMKAFWRNGYATEAAEACKEYAFYVLDAETVCSIIRDSNTASQNVAKRNGMTVADTWTKHYRGVDMPHTLFSTCRSAASRFINLTPENVADEHLCCIIRSKKPHEGVEAKRRWLSMRMKEGHVFRKLNVKGCVFIEYAPLESSWVPVIGDNYIYLYCLWVDSGFKGNGYGRALMEYCVADAKRKGRSGVCMLGSKKQKNWLSNQAFAKRFGFQSVDEACGEYELLALSFDGALPRFSPSCKKGCIESRDLTVYFDSQCPFILQCTNSIREFCREQNIPASLIYVDSLKKAKNLPCVFNNFAVFYNGEFKTVNLIDTEYIKRLLKQQSEAKQ